MLERIIEYTLKQKGMVIFLSLLILVVGLYSYGKLPIDAFPDVTNIQVEVVSDADGLSAIEIERSVTYDRDGYARAARATRWLYYKLQHLLATGAL